MEKQFLNKKVHILVTLADENMYGIKTKNYTGILVEVDDNYCKLQGGYLKEHQSMIIRKEYIVTIQDAE